MMYCVSIYYIYTRRKKFKCSVLTSRPKRPKLSALSEESSDVHPRKVPKASGSLNVLKLDNTSGNVFGILLIQTKIGL